MPRHQGGKGRIGINCEIVIDIYTLLWLGGNTPCPRPGAAARRSNPSYPMLKVRNGGGKEIPLIQGKEQRLCFAGAAIKRYPMPTVRETEVRW